MKQLYTTTLEYLKQISGMKKKSGVFKEVISTIIVFLISANFVYSQDPPPPAGAPYDCKGCVAEDFKNPQYFLGDAYHNKLPDCIAGDNVNAHIWLISNGSSTRYSLLYYYEVRFYDPDDGSLVGPVIYRNACMYTNQPIPIDYIDLGEINWICGLRVEISNVQLAWKQRSDLGCTWDAPKCVCMNYSVVVDAPVVADFEYTTDPCACGPYPVVFNGIASGGEYELGYTYYWDFGDGNSSTEENPTHNYTSTGKYTVQFTVTDALGSSCTKIIEIEVPRDNTPPTFTRPADITIYRDANCNYDAGIAVTGDVTDEYDNCEVGDATFTDIVNSTDPCNVIITRTWSLVDKCGNAAATQVQTITVKDNTSPVINCKESPQIRIIPSNTTQYTAIGTEFDVTATDNCNIVTLTNNLNGSNTLSGYVFGFGETQVTWTATDGCGNSSSCSFTVVVYSPSLTLSKTGTLDMTVVLPADRVDAGDQITYAFTVTNTGNVTLTNVTVTDPKVTVSGGPISSMAPGAVDNSTFTATYTLTQADIDAGTFTNTATATGTFNATQYTDTDDDTQTFTRVASIDIVKSASPTTYTTAGNVISYSYLVTNTGNVTLTGVLVSDDKATVSCPETTLAPGASMTCTASYTITQGDVDGGSVVNTATVTGYFGTTAYTDTDSETVTLNNLPPTITCPSMPVITPCSAEVSGLTAIISDPNNNIVKLTWIMSGATTASSPETGINNLSSYTFQWGITTVSYTVTDAMGLTASCSFIVTVSPCDMPYHCTYTQGFYGNPGGKNCAYIDGEYVETDALTMMQKAFTGLDYVRFGLYSTSRYFDLMKGSITNSTTPEGIFQLLPGGGKPAALLCASTSLDDKSKWGCVPRSVKKSTMGMIANNLLAQTITLWFNMQNDPTLASFKIEGRYMITQESAGCGSDIPVPGTSWYVEFPNSIFDWFGGSFTVQQLFDLANRVLGADPTLPKKSPSASDVDKAIDAINNGFDECRILVGFASAPPVDILPASPAVKTDVLMENDYLPATEFSEVNLTVYPNPFATVVKFEMQVIYDTHVRLEIYNHAGTLLRVICNEDLNQGDIRIVEFDASRYPHTSFLYKLTTTHTMKSGTILKTY